MEAQSHAVDGRLTIRLDARSAAGVPIDQLDVPAVVYSPTGDVRDIHLSQTAPGVYEAVVPADAAGTFLTLVKPRQGDRRLPPVVVGASSSGGAEFRQLRSNGEVLREVARASGGKELSLWSTQDAKLFDRGGVKPLEVLSPIWKPLLAWALLVLLLDIGTRRLAWDRWVSKDFGDGILERARRETRDRAAGAVATLRSLRDRNEEGVSQTAGSSYQPPVLTPADAASAVVARRDQRRAEALSRHTPASDSPVEPGPSAGESGVPTTPAQSSLLAAKRRAAERFKDET